MATKKAIKPRRATGSATTTTYRKRIVPLVAALHDACKQEGVGLLIVTEHAHEPDPGTGTSTCRSSVRAWGSHKQVSPDLRLLAVLACRMCDPVFMASLYKCLSTPVVKKDIKSRKRGNNAGNR